MGETVTLLEHRVRQVVDRLKSLDAERQHLARELEGLREEASHLRLADRERRVALTGAAAALDALARELGEDAPREDA
jgi:FtsZ-binding cell division protein ZapB